MFIGDRKSSIISQDHISSDVKLLTPDFALFKVSNLKAPHTSSH